MLRTRTVLALAALIGILAPLAAAQTPARLCKADSEISCLRQPACQWDSRARKCLIVLEGKILIPKGSEQTGKFGGSTCLEASPLDRCSQGVGKEASDPGGRLKPLGGGKPQPPIGIDKAQQIQKSRSP